MLTPQCSNHGKQHLPPPSKVSRPCFLLRPDGSTLMSRNSCSDESTSTGSGSVALRTEPRLHSHNSSCQASKMATHLPRPCSPRPRTALSRRTPAGAKCSYAHCITYPTRPRGKRKPPLTQWYLPPYDAPSPRPRCGRQGRAEEHGVKSGCRQTRRRLSGDFGWVCESPSVSTAHLQRAWA